MAEHTTNQHSFQTLYEQLILRHKAMANLEEVQDMVATSGSVNDPVTAQFNQLFGMQSEVALFTRNDVHAKEVIDKEHVAEPRGRYGRLGLRKYEAELCALWEKLGALPTIKDKMRDKKRAAVDGLEEIADNRKLPEQKRAKTVKHATSLIDDENLDDLVEKRPKQTITQGERKSNNAQKDRSATTSADGTNVSETKSNGTKRAPVDSARVKDYSESLQNLLVAQDLDIKAWKVAVKLFAAPLNNKELPKVALAVHLLVTRLNLVLEHKANAKNIFANSICDTSTGRTTTEHVPELCEGINMDNVLILSHDQQETPQAGFGSSAEQFDQSNDKLYNKSTLHNDGDLGKELRDFTSGTRSANNGAGDEEKEESHDHGQTSKILGISAGRTSHEHGPGITPHGDHAAPTGQEETPYAGE